MKCCIIIISEVRENNYWKHCSGVKMICYTVVTFVLLVTLPVTTACPDVCDCYHDNLLAELYNYHDSFTADCKRAGLKNVPVGLENETRHLIMSYNNISVLYGDSFHSKRTSMLLTLYLDNNNINMIYLGAFSGLTELRKLKLDNNFITFLSSDIFTNCPNLWSLGLSGNLLDLTPNTHFPNVPSLRALDLSSSEMTEVPKVLLQYSYSMLQELKLNQNNIQYLNTHSLKALLLLELDNNNIEYLSPQTFANNQKLTSLSLNGNPLRQNVDESVINSQSLQYLYLNNCGFKELRENIFTGTPNLVELQLKNNSITVIDNRVFWSLPELHDLSIGDNRITSIYPEAFFHNTKLKVLDLHGNPLLLVPGQQIFKLPSLQNLSLINCSIENLPETALQGVHKLQILSVGCNKFQTINVSALSYLTQLQNLDMSNNPFTCNSTLKEVWNWCKKQHIVSSATCQKPKGDWRILEYLNFDSTGSITIDLDQYCNNKSQSIIETPTDPSKSVLKILLRYGIALGGFVFCVGIILLIRHIVKNRAAYYSYYYYDNNETLLHENENQPVPGISAETTGQLEISIPNTHQGGQTMNTNLQT